MLCETFSALNMVVACARYHVAHACRSDHEVRAVATIMSPKRWGLSARLNHTYWILEYSFVGVLLQ